MLFQWCSLMTQAVLRILQLQCKLKLFSWMFISSPSANRKCRFTPLRSEIRVSKAPAGFLL